MSTRTIADEFFETKPELLKAIKTLEKKRGISLVRKLWREEDTINFFSILAEIRTGLFFDPICSWLRHNFRVDSKRPDWFLTLNGQQIICEVVRLNTPEQESKATIEHSRELRRIQLNNPGVPILEQSGPVTIDTAFLCGAQSKLQQKEAKYRTIIDRHQLPYIICVNPALETLINDIDLNDFLMGRYGFYATDTDFGRRVTGVLLQSYFSGHWMYFPNEKAQFALTMANKKVMEEWWR